MVAALPCPLDETGRINPQVTRFALRDGRFADVVHVKPVYYQHANGAWRPLSEVCSHHGNRDIAIRPDRVSWVHPRFLLWLMRRQRLLGSELAFWAPGYAGVQPWHLEFAATLTAYPDPNPETTTVDGYVSNSNAVWATARSASTGNNASDSPSIAYVRTASTDIYRGFALFSTGSLTSGATVTAGTLSIVPNSTANFDNDGDDWVNVFSSNPASNTALANGDFPQVGDTLDNPTEGSTRVDISGVSTGTYLDFALNAAGLAWISQTGVSKFGFREGHDCIASLPASNNEILWRTADTGGTSSDPKLVVTYTPPPAGLLGNPMRAFIPLLLR